MLKYVATAVSYLLNPLIMPTYGLVFIMLMLNFSILPNLNKMLLLVVFSGTFILPAAIVLLFRYFKIINNVEMRNKEERIVPLLITLLLYLFTFLIIRRLPVPDTILGFVMASIVSLLFTFFITLVWKISVHMIGIGGLAGLVLVLMINTTNPFNILILSLVFVLSGLLGFSRLYLDAHTPTQVYSGFGMGMLVVAFCTAFYLFL
jgi:membrane-associated phospholipid phosphatase